jgi:hypothetical protein
MMGRLRELYGVLLGRVRFLNQRSMHPLAGRQGIASRFMVEPLEPRLLLSTAPTVLSVNRETPAGAATEAGSVTYAVTFSEPVTGVTSADFQLALTGATTASSTFVVSPGSGYNSAYTVTVNNIAGNGTLGLNLVDNGSIVDAGGEASGQWHRKVREPADLRRRGIPWVRRGCGRKWGR